MAFFKTPPFTGHLESFFPPMVSSDQRVQLLAAPSICVGAAIFQVLSKQIKGSHKYELYDHIWKFISKAEARDKVGRVVQYACRSLQGFLGHMAADHWLQAHKSTVAELQTTLAWARRTNRWMKEMPHIPGLGEAITRGDLLEAIQRSILVMFLVQDHIYFLLKVGILKFQKYTPIQWHRRNLRFITASHVFNFMMMYRDLRRAQAKEPDAKDEAALTKLKEAQKDAKMMMVRYVLTFIQMIHVSGVKQLDDWYIGIMGMISSSIDASKQW